MINSLLKKWILIPLLCIVINICSFVSPASAIRLAYVEFPPYEGYVDGEPKGILIDIVTMAFEQAGIPLELRPFARAVIEVESGSLDGLFNFYKTEKRLLHFDYSAPIIKNPLVLWVCKESSFRKFESLDDLKDLKVGLMRGYTYGMAFNHHEHIAREFADSHKSNFSKLLFKRIDTYACDYSVGIYTAQKMGILNQLRTLPTPLIMMEGHIGFTKGKHQDVIRKINIQIKKLQESGTINDIIDKHLGELF
ncbi:MAG: hypothetical protein BA863_09610 [Desulfovibrio sp. S3730MH75]|nr:MAG: hypothetical protein BA863_09610 [Desulfovibrio sp. S3730MH75]